MITPEIIEYIKSERAKNTPDAVIHSNLQANGWNEANIAEAMATLSQRPISSSISTPSTSSIPQALIKNIHSDIYKGHRKKVRWAIFCILSVCSLPSFIGVFQGLYYHGGPSLDHETLFFVLGGFFSICIASFIAGSGSQTHEKKWKSVLDFIARVFFAGGIVMMLSIGILFAGCMFGIIPSGF